MLFSSFQIQSIWRTFCTIATNDLPPIFKAQFCRVQTHTNWLAPHPFWICLACSYKAPPYHMPRYSSSTIKRETHTHTYIPAHTIYSIIMHIIMADLTNRMKAHSKGGGGWQIPQTNLTWLKIPMLDMYSLEKWGVFFFFWRRGQGWVTGQHGVKR